MANENLKILVAAHKPYWMPEDEAYAPIWVNAAANGDGIPAGWLRDDAGDNISHKNATYCELTALYWAWKNLDSDYLGLAHYRRHFSSAKTGEKRARVASGEEILAALGQAPIVLPKKRNYFIETTYSQYAHAHHAKDLDATRCVIVERCPEYLDSFDRSMKSTKGHRFNMFVMRRERFNAYCDWLFGILFALEERIDVSNYSPYDARVFGFVGERLLDVWLGGPGGPPANAVAEMPVMHLESQRWPTKILSFLRRKFLPRK